MSIALGCRVIQPTTSPKVLQFRANLNHQRFFGAWACGRGMPGRQLRRPRADTRAGVMLEVKNLARCPVIQPTPARARRLRGRFWAGLEHPTHTRTGATLGFTVVAAENWRRVLNKKPGHIPAFVFAACPP